MYHLLEITQIPENLFFNCRIGTLAISNNISKIVESSFCECHIDNIIFQQESKLTEICSKAFYKLKCETTIQTPKSVEIIGEMAFYLCNKVKLAGDMHFKYIGNSSFFTYELNLTNVFRIGNYSLQNVQNLEFAT